MNPKSVFSILAFAVATMQLHAGDQEKVDSSRYKIPAGFTENKGQILDNNGIPHSEIKFTAQSGNAQLFFKPDGISYVFSDQKEIKTEHGKIPAKKPEPTTVNYYRTDMQLLGSNPDVIIRGENKQDNYKNFYGQANPEGILNVATYGKIIYENVYPKIDLIYIIDESGLKYDFIVHPGGNPDEIHINYVAADNVSLDKEKGILVKNPLGKISDANPVSFLQENHQAVTTTYSQKENVISFVTGDYDKTKTLDIDPFIRSWGTYYGGLNDDCIRAMDYTPSATFSIAAIYVTGYTYSSAYIATTGAFSTVYGDNIDAFLARFNTNGGITWATYFGGPALDLATCIDANYDEIAIGGSTQSNTGIAGGSFVYQGSRYAQNSITGFVANFNTAGQRIWSTYFGGEFSDNVDGIAIDDVYDRIAICGNAQSTMHIATSGAYLTTRPASGDGGFIALFSSNGSRLWGTYTNPDILDVAFLSNHNIAMGGGDAVNFTIGSGVATIQPTIAGSFDAYVGIINSSGTALVFSTFFGGSGNDQLAAISVDANSDIVAVGWTNSTSNIASSSSVAQTGLAGGDDAFIVKYTPQFTKAWSTYMGGTWDDQAEAVCQNAAGEIFVSGLTTSNSSPSIASWDAMRTVIPSINNDGFVAKYYSSGALSHITYYGTDNGADDIDGIGADDAGNIVIAGISNGTDGSGSFNLATGGTYQSNNKDVTAPYSKDGFIGEFWDNEINVTGFSVSTACAGNTMLVYYTVERSFWTLNHFTAELSDANGNFSNPIVIGSVAGTNSGTIGCTIPLGLAASGNYRIRVRSSLPGIIYSRPSSTTVYLKVTPATPSAFSTNPICSGQTLDLTTPFFQGFTYHWSGPNSFVSSVQNPSLANASSTMNGTYFVRITNLYGCTSPVGSTSVLVNEQTSPETINADGPTKLCEGGTLTLNIVQLTGYSYQWMLNGIDIPGATTNSYQPTASGIYAARIFIINDPCVNYTNNVSVDFYACRLAQTTADAQSNQRLVIYPNPSAGIINFQIPESDQTSSSEILLYNATGSLVYDEMKSNGTDVQLDLHDFSDGIYLIRIKTGNVISENKIVLSK